MLRGVAGDDDDEADGDDPDAESLSEALVEHYFPGVGDPDDLPPREFDRYVQKAVRLERWRRGDAEEGVIDDLKSLLRK